ncbi:MAG: DegV family protein, partial [Clostridiales bacterium]|nr:DegV family protein [Clostridiales bacterium]
MSFWIVSDSCSDLPVEYISKKSHYIQLPMTYEIDGQVYTPTNEKGESKAFYDALRNEKVATTAQINIITWKESFIPLLEKGEQVLCIPFSSG